MSISAEADEHDGWYGYAVPFSGVLGSTHCAGGRAGWGQPSWVQGEIEFPDEIDGAILKTRVPCTAIEASLRPLVVHDVIEVPRCNHSGRVSGESDRLGVVTGKGGYLTFGSCPG